jgi:two-component system NtrC family sensor kinase
LQDKKQSVRSIRRLTNYLINKCCPFNIRIFKSVVIVITIVLMASVLILAWTSSRKVKEVVTSDFNQQQLMLAQHTARQIESNLNLLKKDLTLLSLSPSIQYFETVSIGKRMQITFSGVSEEGTLEIRYLESSGTRSHLVDKHGYQTVHPDPHNISLLQWASQEKNQGNILMSEVSKIIYDNNYQTLIMKMAIPVWQVSVDETNPVATNKFSGVLILVLDVTKLTENITEGIRSGKTGYAWVMDQKGTFLYHPEKEFIGKNAFEVRKEKKPTISFARINEIQKEMMLAGKEGTSWYISGWHRGREGEMKKLIAYTPIQMEKQLWSVAVVAPISEVEDSIHSVQVRQILLQTLIIIIILLGGLTVISLMANWSRTLEREVEKKTIEFKKSEERYKSLVEHAEDIIFTVDSKGNFLSMNRFGYNLMEKSPEDVIGGNIANYCTDDSVLHLIQTIKEVFESSTSKQTICSLMFGGNEHVLSTNFSGLQDENGKVFAVLGIARDITRRKKMEEQMFYTEKLASIGTLAAGVAHEINNPLAIILGFSDLLMEKTPPDSQAYEMLKTIEKQGLNAKRVVENLLGFTRFSEHKEETVDINKNLESVLSFVSNTLLLNKISVIKDLSLSLPEVKGDPGEIQQVFFNIINNAIAAMKGGGLLMVSTKEVNEQRNVEIRIQDSGCGIRKEYRTKIFDPLFTTKKVGEGTGLGLFVSYGIITKHGGTITFDSIANDECSESGTTFVITLPAADQTAVV